MANHPSPLILYRGDINELLNYIRVLSAPVHVGLEMAQKHTDLWLLVRRLCFSQSAKLLVKSKANYILRYLLSI